jgi:hypothetical protein
MGLGRKLPLDIRTRISLFEEMKLELNLEFKICHGMQGASAKTLQHKMAADSLGGRKPARKGRVLEDL